MAVVNDLVGRLPHPTDRRPRGNRHAAGHTEERASLKLHAYHKNPFVPLKQVEVDKIGCSTVVTPSAATLKSPALNNNDCRAHRPIHTAFLAKLQAN